jgi:50S ribosome-binding GTPase
MVWIAVVAITMIIARAIGARAFIGSSAKLGKRPVLMNAPFRLLETTTHTTQQVHFYSTTARFLSTKSGKGEEESTSKEQKHKTNKKKSSTKQKWKINPNIGQANIDKLAAAFDELARKEGFDPSMSHMAEDKSFEDDFLEDDFDGDDDEELELTEDDLLDPTSFNINDFNEMDERGLEAKRTDAEEDEFDDDDDDDDYSLDFGGGDDDDMDARIAAAKKDMSSGRVSVPKELSNFAQTASELDLKRLGFKKELNPFGNDETPRRQQFKLISNAMTCPACGSDFQCQNDKKPGFLPPEKFEIQVKLSRIEEMQQLKTKADTSEWSVEDEVEFLIQSSASGGKRADGSADDIDIDAMAEEMGLDLVELASKRVICKRCHGLQNSGKVEDSLRPGWTDEPTMSQEKFRKLLQPIGEKPAVIVALVDLFDFTGSVLKELDSIAGNNPVILAANKVDLLPEQMGQNRVESWVRRELEYLGVKSLANIGGAVRLISCKTGSGVSAMLAKARSLAEEMDCDVYVVGAANAGKSTLINHILGYEKENPTGKIRAGNRNSMKGALTTSPLPGTTLKFIRVDLGDGRSLYDSTFQESSEHLVMSFRSILQNSPFVTAFVVAFCFRST